MAKPLPPAAASALVAALALLSMAPVASPLAGPGVLPLPSQDPAVVGRWSPPFEGQVAAVSMALVPGGEVLYWSGADTRDVLVSLVVEDPERALARVLDLSGPEPVIHAPTPEAGGPGDLYCAGQALLADGRILVAGGNRYVSLGEGGPHQYGLDQAVGYRAAERTFDLLADMAFWRWYPTVVPLADGGALAVSGTRDLYDSSGMVRTSERYDPATDRWVSLPPGADNLLPTYPHVMEVPSGPYAGQVAYVPGGCIGCTVLGSPEWHLVQTLDLETATWTKHAGAVQPAREYGASVLLPLAAPGYAARVLSLGGTPVSTLEGSPASPDAAITDLATAPPTVRPASPMGLPRWFPQAVLLPTGEVLAVGGGLTNHKTSRFGPPALAAEVYDPRGLDPLTGLPGRWTPLASMQLPRLYHSTALLLDDGRVLAGGHVSLGAAAPGLVAAYDSSFEVFEPPYLFRGPRPAIGEAPASAVRGAVLEVTTPDASRISGAVLMRPGATTHAVDAGQRLVELTVLGAEGPALRLGVPGDAMVVPDGPWMLFLLQDHGQGPVPSVAHWVRVTG